LPPSRARCPNSSERRLTSGVPPAARFRRASGRCQVAAQGRAEGSGVHPETEGGRPVDFDPVTELEREWRALAPGIAVRLRGWQTQEPGLAPFSSAQLLVRYLQRYDADLDAKDAALAALLRRAQTEPVAGRIILQALLPGLKRLAQPLIRNAQAREEVWST